MTKIVENNAKTFIKNRLNEVSHKIIRQGLNWENYKKDDLKKLLFSQVNGCAFENLKKSSLKKRQEYMFEVCNLIEQLTPREFTQVFPIRKTYDGCKYECKDYFSTVKSIEKIGWDKKITNAFEFLWDFSWGNRNISYLTLFMMDVLSDNIKRKKGIGIFEEFMNEKQIN